MSSDSTAATVIGKVFLVGAGPGAADLVTLRAARVLGEADLVLEHRQADQDRLVLRLLAQKVF